MPLPDNIKPYNVPDDYLLEIGRIALYWNQLESLITHCMIVTLCGAFSEDGKALALITHMSFPQKLDALSAMLKLEDPEIEQLYRTKAQPLLKGSQERRNATLHQNWYASPKGVTRFDIKARGELKTTSVLVSLQELKQVSHYILNAQMELMNGVLVPFISK